MKIRKDFRKKNLLMTAILFVIMMVLCLLSGTNVLIAAMAAIICLGFKMFKVEIGQIATAMTVLRPSGFIELNGEKLDAIAESEWIRKGASVEIIQIEGRKIIVKEI